MQISNKQQQQQRQGWWQCTSKKVGSLSSPIQLEPPLLLPLLLAHLHSEWYRVLVPLWLWHSRPFEIEKFLFFYLTPPARSHASTPHMSRATKWKQVTCTEYLKFSPHPSTKQAKALCVSSCKHAKFKRLLKWLSNTFPNQTSAFVLGFLLVFMDAQERKIEIATPGKRVSHRLGYNSNPEYLITTQTWCFLTVTQPSS